MNNASVNPTFVKAYLKTYGAAFVQDSWKPTSKLTLNLGLRSRRIVVPPGATYALHLAQELDLTVAKETRSGGQVTLRISAEGPGRPPAVGACRQSHFIRAAGQGRDARPGRCANPPVAGKATREDTSWVAVIIPDGDLGQKQELTGSERH